MSSGPPDRRRWAGLTAGAEVRWARERPAVAGNWADWPGWLAAEPVAAFGRAGIDRPWTHQRSAMDAARAGHTVVLATGTASGKSLGYLAPVLAATLEAAPDVAPALSTAAAAEPIDWAALLAQRAGPPSALYLAPTKALAHDQYRAARELGIDRWRVATLDGDTEPVARDWVRDHANYVLSNPDMLHRSVLPQHARWSRLLGSLAYVVVDEAHRYRGLFGSQVAAMLRRLRRLAASYGADPTFIACSATTANPGEATAALFGVSEAEVVVLAEDDSAHAERELICWQSDEEPDVAAADLLARLVVAGHQTIAFTPSRRGAELVARRARAAGAGDLVEPYRAGYLAADRRRIEADLRSGVLRGVASTNALELGVDIAGADAVVLAGFPGTRSAFWQQVGRAGRRDRPALGVLIPRRHPLDAHFAEHPEALLGEPVEATVVAADNPHVLGPQLAAAAQELPLTEADERWFGPSFSTLVARLEQAGTLRRRPTGWYAAAPGRVVDTIDLRAAGDQHVQIVELDSGRVLGVLDPVGADSAVHPGAVYLHQGETYLCEELDLAVGEALVRPARPGYLTQAVRRSGIHVLETIRSRTVGAGTIWFGSVEVRSQVTSYLRRDEQSGSVWDSTPLELPVRSLTTTAAWLTLDAGLVDESISRAGLAGGAHAAEHLLVALLPLFAPCDRFDIDGVTAPEHADTGAITVFVHDGTPGGAGFAERAYAVAPAWLAAAGERLRRCPCEAGCPACIVTSHCGSIQLPLDKASAVKLLELWCPDGRMIGEDNEP